MIQQVYYLYFKVSKTRFTILTFQWGFLRFNKRLIEESAVLENVRFFPILHECYKKYVLN